MVCGAKDIIHLFYTMSWKIKIHFNRILFLCLSSFILLLLAIWSLNRGVVNIIEWEFISLNSCSIVVRLILDWISFMFLRFVFFISSIVLFYRGDYILGDLNFNRFMYLVLCFVASIGALIVSPNLIRILLGWDGLGLVSYALVIYYSNEKSSNAGILTVLSNRVGDVAILLRIALIFNIGGWNFVYYTEYIENEGLYNLLKVLVVLAAITKRAQIPFSAWLPAAIAAPTPVSSLVHSSTLVTAGVYLLIRFRRILYGSEVQSFLLIISCLTIFIAGLGANFEYDLKKIIALSTLSQLGVIIRILRLGFADLAFFHLLSHALFKALLFICAGVIIHNSKEYQDIRCMGGLAEFIPLTRICINLANLALCGIPFLAGFYSKDIILEVAFIRKINFIAFILYALATGLTVCYTFRLIFYRLSGRFNLSRLRIISDRSVVITSSIMGLSVGAIIGGCFLSWLIFPEPYTICMRVEIKTLPLSVRILGGFIGYILNNINVNFNLKSLNLYKRVVVMGSMWFIPFLSTFSLNFQGLKLGQLVSKVGDGGWSEYYGGQGVYKFVTTGSQDLQVFQDNRVKIIIKIFIIWFIILFFII